MRNNLLGDGAGCKGVFKLVSPATGEAFAVKLVERHRSSEAAAKHSFEKEVTIFYKLRHPGICRLRTVVSDARYHMHLRKAGWSVRKALVYRELEDLSHTYPREENARIIEWFDPRRAAPA